MNTPKISTSRSTVLTVSGHQWLTLFISLMVISLALSYDALAFQKSSAGNTEHRIRVLSEQLELTEEQAQQIRPILENQNQKRNEILESYAALGNDDRRALKAEMRTLREDTHSQIKALLTEEQIAKYKNWQEERRRKMRNRGGQGRKSMPPDTY